MDKDVLQQALVDIITQAVNTVGQAKDFLVADLPDVAQQALMYYGILGGIKFVVWLMAQFLSYNLMRSVIDDKCSLTDDERHFLFLVGLGLSAITTLFLLNFEWLKVLVAPKLWLLEYASNMIN